MKRLMTVVLAALAGTAVADEDNAILAKLSPIVHHIAAPREWVSLCGTWEWAPVKNTMEPYTNKQGRVAKRVKYEPTFAEGLASIKPKDWKPYVVPGVLPVGNDRQDGYCRRTFEVKDGWIGKRMKLHFELNYQTFKVFVNGVDCGKYRRWGVPTDVDITKAVKAGTNELVVVLQVDGSRFTWEDGACDWRPDWGGGQTGMRRPVHLEVMDRVYVADVINGATVNPTNRDENVFHAVIVVRNDSDAKKEVEVRAEVQSEWCARPQTVVVPAHGAAEVKIDQPWPTVRPWNPDEPNLYFCDVSLAERATPPQGARNAGEPFAPRAVDAFRRRFGFTEVKIVKDRILFNGYPVFLRRGSDGGASADKGDRFREFGRNRQSGCVGARLWIDWDRACDQADEFGYFFTPVASQGWGSAYRNQEKFWPLYGRHLKEFVEALRHHPSILYWCASNEFGTIYGGNEGGPLEEPTQKRQAATQPILTATDRLMSRPWEACGEVEVGYPVKGSRGPAPIRSYHYPIAYNSDGYELPEAAYWYEKGVLPWQRIATRDKPTSISEDMYHGFMDQFFGISRFAGDRIYAPGGHAEALKEAGSLVAEGVYSCGMTTWEPWCFYPTVPSCRLYRGRSVHPDYLVALRDFNRSLRAGVPETRTAFVYNQNFRTVTATLTRLFKVDGRVISSTNSTLVLTPGCKIELAETIPTPAVDAPAKLTLEYDLRGPGPGHARPILDRRTYVFNVYPEEKRFDAGESCALLAAADSPLATRGRWTKGVFADAQAAVGSGAKRIVVAKALTVAEGRVLESFVEDDGRVLIIEATETSWTPIDLVFRRPVAHAFRRDDRALPGLDDSMLSVWRGDSGLGTASYPKPGEDGAVLVDCGHIAGLDSFMIGWLYRGEGAYLLCQMPVLSRLDTEPAAGHVLKAVLAEFAKDFETPEESVVCLGGEKMRDVLARSGIRTAKRGEVVLVDISGAAFDAELSEAFEDAVDDGKTVFVTGVDMTNATEVLAKYGVETYLDPPYAVATGWVQTGAPWVTRQDNDGLFAGLANDDLYWWARAKKAEMFCLSDYTGGWRYPEFTSRRDRTIDTTMVKALFRTRPGSRAVVRTSPGAVVEVRDDDARIVFSSLALVENYPNASAKIARVLRAWLNNAGAKTSEPPPVREYEFVDIASSFNRALWRDEVNQKADGTYEPEGWFANADGNDMRFYPVNLCGWSLASNNMCPKEPWPTEPMRLGPVSFRLPIEDPNRTGSKACLVLLPGEEAKVALPAGTKASALWFLGAANVGDATIEMRVNGEGEPVVFRKGDHFNCYRWTGDVKEGSIAWVGYTKKDPMATLYTWRWRNPAPDVPVRFLTLRHAGPEQKPGKDPNLGGFALTGLTLEK